MRGISISSVVDVLILVYANGLVFLTVYSAWITRLCRTLYEYFEKNKMNLNPRKSQIIAFGKGSPSFNKQNIYYGTNKTKVLKEYKCLGITFIK